MIGSRKVELRSGQAGRYLRASINEEGGLQLHGEDFGPEIAVVTPRDSYEWYETVAARDIPRLAELLGGQPEDDILDVLERDWCGDRADEFVKRLRASGINVSRHVI